MIHFGTGGWRAVIGDGFTKANVQLLTLALARKMLRCCFSKRMRKVFRRNEKSMLQKCNKKAKRKGRLQRVKKPM